MDDNRRDNEFEKDNQPENNGKQESEEKTPDYSFWAEQISKNSSHKESYYPRDYSNDKDNEGWSQQTVEAKPEKKKKSLGKFLLKALCFGLVAGVAFIGINFVFDWFNPNTGDDNYILSIAGEDESKDENGLKVETTSPGAVESIHSSRISEVIEQTMPSIVSIRSVTSQQDYWFGVDVPREGRGSGIIIAQNEEELLIATNNHVVAGANQILVTFSDGEESQAVIKGADATADLAVITVEISDISPDTLKEISIVKMGNSDNVKVGEMTIAIGNALGYGQSATVGYVSAKDREVQVSDNYTYRTMVLLQTDAAINPGNSGGALLNLDGELIGINTIKYADYKVEGMGFAIPISRAEPIINELKEREILSVEEQGYLGVLPTDVTEEISEALNMPIGVFLTTVEEGSAAEKAGLKEGDIITKFNDLEITSSDQLREKISSIRVGTDIEIVYMRNINGTFKEYTTNTTLTSRPQ